MYGDWDINWLAVAAVVISYLSAPIILSVATGVVCGLWLPRVSAFSSALMGAGIGLLGSLFCAVWVFLSLGLVSSLDMGDDALLAFLIGGPVAASFACAWFTWTTILGWADSALQDAGAA